MDAIYDRKGHVVGWRDGDEFMDLRGSYVAFGVGGSVYSYKDGRHLAWWSDDVMRGRDGGVVSYLRTASGFGPMRPMLAMAPMRPMRAMRPMKPMRALSPARPMRSSSWSTTTFGDW
jgi:hypothetical protein